MKHLLFFLLSAGCALGSDPAIERADLSIEACGVPESKEPALDSCRADCYNRARCIEITGRLLYPQPGEATGQTIYSNLDVCLESCR